MDLPPPLWTHQRVEASKREDVDLLLDDVCWHDSVVHSINCVRAASADEVVVLGPLLYDWDTQQSCLARVTFRGCYRVNMDMNWGVTCMSDGEMIGRLEFSDVHPEIDAVRLEWRATLPPLFRVELQFSTTGSTVRIVFQSLCIEPMGEPGAHSAPPPLLPGTELPDPKT